MLTESVVRDAEPREKTYKLSDTGGLFVMVNPDGSRWWRLRYKYGEKERGISLGTYPLVSLKLARQSGMMRNGCFRMGWIPVTSGVCRGFRRR
jgi:Arm DNA-binding domain